MDILPFTKANLAQRLYSRKYRLSPDNVPSDPHIIFLMEHLGPTGLQASYILTEPKYISRDYLDGFASYYSRSFRAPDPDCQRIHFFHSTKAPDLFRESLTRAILHTDEPSDQFWREDYLGFIVVKPLAVCNIGYTVLKHYNHNPNRAPHNLARHMWATKEYVCHIFGRKVSIDSLAFQEQDTNLAACASVAVWTALQMADLDQPMLRKSPGQITRDAGPTAYGGNRLVPNEGLTVEQVCTAITANGLMTEVREFSADGRKKFDMSRLRRLVDAYSGLKIPIILALEVPDKGDYYGHAIAIAGHELQEKPLVDPPVADGPRPMVHRADAISKFYAHDDGWGCFSRIVIEKNDRGLRSAWNRNPVDKDKLCKPISLIIPVPPKVRIPYEDIKALVYFPDSLLKAFFDEKGRKTAVSWDIKLEYSETLKRHLAQLPYWSSDSYAPLKMAILQTNMPRYIWVATCYWNNVETISIVFDATEMKSGMLGLHLIFHGYEEQQFVGEKIPTVTDEKIRAWRIRKSADLDYWLHFMDKHWQEFMLPEPTVA